MREKLKITLFRTLLQKEKHVGTLFFHIFVIILAERVIKLCIFFFISNKTSNCGLNWIYEKKEENFRTLEFTVHEVVNQGRRKQGAV